MTPPPITSTSLPLGSMTRHSTLARQVWRISFVGPTIPTMMDATRTAEDFLYGNQGPWPQPSPRDPKGMPGAVLHVPLPERLELSLLVISRYRATVAAYT